MGFMVDSPNAHHLSHKHEAFYIRSEDKVALDASFHGYGAHAAVTLKSTASCHSTPSYRQS